MYVALGALRSIEAHAVRAEERDPRLERDRGDLGLHPRGGLATLDHAAARDDHGGNAGCGRVARRRRRAQRVQRHDDDVRHLWQ